MQLATDHFIFQYDQKDSDIVGFFLDSLENAFHRICDSFHFDCSALSAPYTFCICPDVDAYIEATGKTREEYQSWMVGNSDAVQKRIVILSPKGAIDCTLEYLQSVAIHELVHMIFDDVTKTDETEEWIAEGIAILFSGQTDLNYVSEGNYPLVSQISGSAFADNGGYDYAGIYVWYFIKQFGFEEYLRVYKNQVKPEERIYPGFELEAIREYRKEAV